jgi:archaetidylinositol phosphate synthase
MGNDMEKRPADIHTHKRTLDTLTGPLEKRLLIWIAKRLPGWTTPDHLTIIGVIGAFVVFSGYALSNLSPAFLWLATLGFVINWFGDSMDGTLARVRKIERPIYGFYIDHTTDAFVEILIFLGLGISPFVQFEIACLALIGYLLLSVLVYVQTCVRGEFTISYGKLGPTEVRLLAIFGNTLVFFFGNPELSFLSLRLTVYEWLVVMVVLLLAVISVSTMIHQARLLSQLD